MATYTPPDGDAVNFTFAGGYSAPDGDQVHFLFGIVAAITINSISRTTLADDDGFDVSTVNWQSSAAGDYKVEVGGSGAGLGLAAETGSIGADVSINTDIFHTDITTWSGYTGEPEDYEINIYVKSSDDIWTPYHYSG